MPDSILEKSRISLMMSSSECPARFDRRQQLALLRRQLGFQRQIGHADDAVHRRADFVAHVRQEVALGAVGGFGSLLCREHFRPSTCFLPVMSECVPVMRSARPAALRS
jgi:hypothetical protein